MPLVPVGANSSAGLQPVLSAVRFVPGLLIRNRGTGECLNIRCVEFDDELRHANLNLIHPMRAAFDATVCRPRPQRALAIF